MPELKIPPHPDHDRSCKKCQFWLRGDRRNYMFGKGPPQAFQGPTDKVPDHVTWANMAPCTRFPTWHLASKDHWCAEYRARGEQAGPSSGMLLSNGTTIPDSKK